MRNTGFRNFLAWVISGAVILLGVPQVMKHLHGSYATLGMLVLLVIAAAVLVGNLRDEGDVPPELEQDDEEKAEQGTEEEKE